MLAAPEGSVSRQVKPRNFARSLDRKVVGRPFGLRQHHVIIQIYRVNPFIVLGSRVPGEMLASNLSSVERLRIKDAIRIENICQPECCLSFGGVNCQSDLPESLDFSVAFANVCYSFVVNRFYGFASRD